MLIALFFIHSKVNAQAIQYEWAKGLGNIGFDRGRSIAVDASQNVYITGTFGGTVDFNPGGAPNNLSSVGGSDIFLAKYDKFGNNIWAYNVGSSGNDEATSIFLDASGNIYITGYFRLTADFDPGAGINTLSAVGGSDIFVAKYNNAGNFIWAKSIGGGVDDESADVKVDVSGNVYFTGFFQGVGVDFDPGVGTALLNSTGDRDIFFAKLNSNGDYLWANSIGGTLEDLSNALALDASGNVLLTGSFRLTADFDPGAGIANLTIAATANMFFAKYDTNGNYVWAYSIGNTTASELGTGITTDAAGNIYITGGYATTVDFDPGVGIANLSTGANNVADCFVAKYSNNGIYNWAISLGDAGTTADVGNDIEVDVDGSVYVTGRYSSASADFDPSGNSFTLPFAGTGSNTFFAKYNNSGVFQWVNRLGGSSAIGSIGFGIAIDASKNVHVIGGFYDTDFDVDGAGGSVTLSSPGSSNVFFVKYAANAPTITSFTPISGAVGATVTITGTNFSNTPTNNVVIFGAKRATVTAATATQLTVTVPVGATYAPITVLNTTTGLLANSNRNFTPTFTPNKGSIATTDFDPKLDFATGVQPRSVSVGDLDGDGKADLAVANQGSNDVSIFRNIGNAGTVAYAARVDFATTPGPYSVSIGDLDGDGKADLAVANFSSNTISIFRNTSSVGTIGFATRADFTTGTNPISVSIGDLDGDGKADLAVSNQGSNNVSVFRNTSNVGAIGFAPRVDFIIGSLTAAVSIGDLDGDSRADLAVVNANSTVSVLRNTSNVGAIGFAPRVDFSTTLVPASVAIGDLDGDGRADLAVAGGGTVGVASVFRNTSPGPGTINFAARVDFAVQLNPLSVSIGDLDGDGQADLAVANANSSTVSVLHNTSNVGTASFAARVDLTTGSGSFSVAIGDLDGDGKVDLSVANGVSNTVSVIRNNPFLPTPPNIQFSSVATQIANNGTYQFGGQNSSCSASFTLSNSGQIPLNISLISLSNSDFTFVNPLPTIIAGGSSETFTVRMATDPVGSKAAQITVVSDAVNISTYVVNLQGQALLPAAPSNLIVELSLNSGGELNLSWIGNATNECNFELQRASGNSLAASFRTVDNPALNSNSALVAVNRDTTYFFRIRAVNNLGVSAWSNIVGGASFVPFSALTSISNPLDSDWLVYPNPSTGQFTFQNARCAGQVVSAELFNLHGQWMHNFQIVLLDDGSTVFELNDLPAGFYLLHWKVGHEQGIKKLVKE